MYPQFFRGHVRKRRESQEDNIVPSIPYSARGSAIHPTDWRLQYQPAIPSTHSAIPPPISLHNQQHSAAHGNIRIPNPHSASPPPISLRNQQDARIHGNPRMTDTHSAVPRPVSLHNQTYCGLHENVYPSASTFNEYEKLIILNT